VPIDPRGWPEMDVHISVGLGIGDKMERMAAANSIIQDYQLILQSPFASMVGPEQVYNALKMKYNAADIKNVDDFLIEPNEENMAAQQEEEQPDPAVMQAQAEIERKMQAQQFEQQLKAQAQEFEQAIQTARAEFEAGLAIDKANYEIELAAYKARLQAANDMTISQNRPGGRLDQ